MFRSHKLFIAGYTIFFICLFYIIFSQQITRNIFHLTHLSYYNFLLDGFFHNRTHIFSPIQYDLSFFQGKWYMYWGPAPVLFILPFYLIAGVSASDIFYTLVAGILNVFLFYMVLRETQKYFKYKLSLFSELFLVISFGLCSPNLFLSLIGTVWGTSQIVAVWYLLVSYFCYFKFLNTKKTLFFIIAILFFNLAWLSRYTMIFGAILFLFPIIKEQNKNLRRILIAVSIGVTTIFLLGFLSYNAVRFGNPLELGMRYVRGDDRYSSITQNNTLLSFAYVPHNIYHYFFNPPQFSLQSPYVYVNKEGNSMFFVYPALLLLPLYRKGLVTQGKSIRLFTLFSGIIFFCTMLFFLFYFCTGWKQFGLRYLLDIMPLLYIVLSFIINSIPKKIAGGILLYGMLINMLGIYSFFFFH